MKLLLPVLCGLTAALGGVKGVGAPGAESTELGAGNTVTATSTPQVQISFTALGGSWSGSAGWTGIDEATDVTIPKNGLEKQCFNVNERVVFYRYGHSVFAGGAIVPHFGMAKVIFTVTSQMNTFVQYLPLNLSCVNAGVPGAPVGDIAGGYGCLSESPNAPFNRWDQPAQDAEIRGMHEFDTGKRSA
jgi:hypothetical protein